MKLLSSLRSPWRLGAGAVIVLALLAWGVVSLARPAPFDSAQAAEVLNTPVDPAMEKDVTQGALRVKSESGEIVECPLKHTDVKADISGFIARATVTQTFYNPYDEKIEAVYVFPLPHTAAVDAMTMVIGDKRIVGVIKRRAEARAIYEQALAQGLTASLLEQERPNIFTQSVGNIKPKQEIRIEISYVDVLAYDMGTYEFHFPMVVGPRYIPGAPISGKAPTPPELQGKVGDVPAPANGNAPAGTGWSPDTDRVPDASRITPPVLKPEFRNGHDISLSVTMDAGVPIQDIKIPNHKVDLRRQGDSGATVKLADGDTVPNKDFVMKYAVVGEQPELAMLAHAPDSGGGYFMLMMQPKLDKELAQAPPREVVFLVDVSGSMSGAPTEKVKESMREFFKRSKPSDTFQLITFAGMATKIFERPVPASPENVAKALNAVNQYQAGGGTEMLKGIQMTLNDPPDPERVRIVILLTDGYIGNEAEIIAEVGKRAGDRIRFWTIGIGSSPNRFLIDGVAKTGGGKSAVLELTTNPSELVGNIVNRIHRAQLAGITVDWGGLPVEEIYPRAVPELWAGSPVVLFGRYTGGGTGRVRLSGMAEGKPLAYALDVSLPDHEIEHDVLAKVWARNKIEDLSAQMFYGDTPEVVEEITGVALEYRLMSQYTSFVAVDENDADRTASAKPPRRMPVAVPLPDGVSFDGVFGAVKTEAVDRLQSLGYVSGSLSSTLATAPAAMPAPSKPGAGAAGMRGPAGQPGPVGAPGRVYASRKRAASTHAKLPANATAGNAFFSYDARVDGKADFYRLADVPGERAMNAEQTYARNLFSTQAEQRHQEAKAALAEAEKLKKDGKSDAAHARYQQAYLLGRAALSARPWQDDGTLADAADGLAAVGVALAAQRSKALPALERKLDLVLRDMTLEEALNALQRASGIDITLLPGSVDDVCALNDLPELRVAYLDLRGATAAQALDWLLIPRQMSWQLKGRAVLAGSARRLPGASAWVYRVGDFAMPVNLDKANPQQAAEKALKEFQTGAGHVLAKGETAALLTADLLMVYADGDDHQRMQALLTAFRQTKGALEPVLARALDKEGEQAIDALRRQTAARWAARANERAQRAQDLAKARVLQAMSAGGWQLLAGAAKGDVDEEALTELQIAWRNPLLGKLTDDVSANLALRSAWAISQAARMLPKEAAVQRLAATALPFVRERLAGRERAKPVVGADQLGLLYGALALRNGERLGVNKIIANADIEALLTRGEGEPLKQPVSIMALSLLAPTKDSDRALKEMIDNVQLYGPDLVALGYLAVRERGGDLQQAFVRNQPDLLGKQPLDGNVILFVNRLAARAQVAAGMQG